MRTTRLLPLLTVLGCGSPVEVTGAGEGGGTSSASQAPTTSGSSTGSTGGAGGTESTGSGGAGGAGGAPLPPVARVVTVQSYDGLPESAVHVVGHDAAGAVIDHELTAPDGTASVLAPDDGMVTVGYETVRVLPDGNGGSDVIAHRQLVTIAAIGPTPTLSHRLSESRHRTENPPMTLAVDAGFPAADDVRVFVLCDPTPPTWIAPAGTSAFEVRGCPGEPTFDVEVVASGMNMSLGRKIFEDVAFQPGQTTTLAVAEADLEPPPVNHVFSTSAYAIGRDAQGNYRSFSTNLGGSTGWEFSTPLSDGVSTWLVAEVFGPSLFRYRTMATIPASTVGTAPALLTPSAATVTTRAPLQPALSWTFSGNGDAGDAVQISWWALDPAAPATWTFFAPAGTTAMAYPSLPLAAQPLMPCQGNGCGFQLYTVLAESPGAGVHELFTSRWADAARAPAPFSPHP